jgi:hypothetical protein
MDLKRRSNLETFFHEGAFFSSSSLLLSSLVFSDTKVYEPQVRSLLGTGVSIVLSSLNGCFYRVIIRERVCVSGMCPWNDVFIVHSSERMCIHMYPCIRAQGASVAELSVHGCTVG